MSNDPRTKAVRSRCGRWLSAASTALSWLTILVVAGGFAFQKFLDGRARWSGEAAPAAWLAAASSDDRMILEGREITYWGNPEARYSRYATRSKKKPVAIVVHYTSAKPVRSLVDYGHRRDMGRGGASFGYHFYIGRDGAIVQGAPLTRRTNHIKFRTNPRRTETARYLWSGNTIGVSLVGGCDPLMRPNLETWRYCSEEFVTAKQLEAGLAVIRALQARYGMRCTEVYGHGDLQTDRQNFEGYRLSRLARAECDVPQAPVPRPPTTEAAVKGDKSGS
jgi:N-acetyl-anhydromuramyl-L-alanine amidase AmpD